MKCPNKLVHYAKTNIEYDIMYVILHFQFRKDDSIPVVTISPLQEILHRHCTMSGYRPNVPVTRQPSHCGVLGCSLSSSDDFTYELLSEFPQM